MKKYAIGLLASVSALGVGAGASAQETSESGGGRILDSIVVTAQKKEENLQNVPISISAFSGDDLATLGLNQSNELGQFIPGLEISTSSGQGSQLIVFMRGAGLNDFNTNNSGPIGIYADEVFVSSPILTSFQFFDAERLEVLKGPQGTLYGRNTTGGAIKFISNKPTDEFEFKARGSYGRFDTTEIEAAISGPITDRIRARAAVIKNDSDGYVKNLVTGDYENGVDTIAWRGIVDFDATDNFTIRGSVHGASSDSPGFKPNQLSVGPGGADALGYSAPADVFTGEYNESKKNDLNSIGGYIEAKWDLPGFTVTSISAYDEVDSVVAEETDGSPLSMISIDYGVESETFTQELRFNGQFGRVEWLLGGYYLTEDLTQNQTVDLFRELRVFTGGLSDPNGDITGAPVLFDRTLNDQETKSVAVFAQTEIAVTDALTVTLGGRYTDEERTFAATSTLEDEALFGPDGVPIYNFSGLKLHDDAFSWRFGIDYALGDQALLYASASRGFKSGGFNGGFLAFDPVEAALQLDPYQPEFVTAYEVGFKSDLLDNRLRLNGAFFYNDFSDLQVFTLVNTGVIPIQVLDNASGAEVYGFEFDAVYYPVDNLLLNFTGAFQHSELVDFVSGAGADFSGNKIALTPDASVTALARYDYNLANLGDLYIQGSVAYRSSVFFSTENNPLLEQDGYALVNARVGFKHSSERWELAVFGKNLTDEAYVTYAGDLSDFGFMQRYIGMPRIWGVELAINF